VSLSAVELANTRHVYAWILFALWLLFCLRVLGQILVMYAGVSFLPRKEEWFSGLMPYPELLGSQVILVLLYGKAWFDLLAGRGWFARPSATFGAGLLKFGCTYLAVMILRYVLRMGLYPRERWVGGCIPIFFHWVLSLFIVVLGLYHLQASGDGLGAGPLLGALGWGWCALVLTAVILWGGYMAAPAVLGWRLGLRRSIFAVRAEKQADCAGEPLMDVFRPYRAVRTSILIFCFEPGSRWDHFQEKLVWKMWAERGYTVVLVSEASSLASALQWAEEQDCFDREVVVWPTKSIRELIAQIRCGKYPEQMSGLAKV